MTHSADFLFLKSKLLPLPKICSNQFYKFSETKASKLSNRHCLLNLARNNERAYPWFMRKERAYHSDPEILGGTLVFKGTRVPVQSLFDHLKAGDSIEVFLDGFPSVKRSQVLAVLKEMETEVLTHA